MLSASPVGNAFPVNTTKAGEQWDSSVASDADGDFVITWEDTSGHDGNGDGVYAQRYSAAGIALGEEFRVNTYTASHQSNPSVAMDADGDFVIAWQSYLQEGIPGFGIYAQRYDATGTPVGSEFHVNNYISSQQTMPSVAMDSDGDFVITWQSYGQLGVGFGTRVYGRRYNASGVAQGGEFPVDVDQPSAQVDPAVAMNAAGDFVITWSSADSSDDGIYAKGYDADGSAIMDTFPVNTDQLNKQNSPSIAADVDGDFVIVWQSAAQGNVNYDIYAQRFSGATRALAGEQFKVNSDPGYIPSVSMDASGDFVIAWNRGSTYGIYAKQYNSSGSVVKEEFAVNSHINLGAPTVAMDADGDFVVTFSGIGVEVPTATYQNSNGILAQRFDESTSTAGPVVTAVLDGNRRIIQGGRFSTSVEALNVLFSEDLNVVGGIVGGSSVLNPANWRLTQNGANVSSLISNVAFGFNNLTNKYEATISFSESLSAGTYKLTALDAIQDLAGNSLDGNLDGIPGGDYVHTFAIEDPKPEGPEFRVNKLFTTGDQLASSVAMDADGDSVVVWQSYGQDGSGWGVYAQRYDASGIPQGNDFLVNSGTTSGNQKNPSVAMDPDGNFVIAWDGADGDGYGVYAKKFNAAGVVTSGPFLINTAQASQQRTSSVAMDVSGDFIISWYSLSQDGSGYGVYARKFDASFNSLVSPFLLNETFVTGDQRNSSVATDAHGNFVATWSSQGQDGSGNGIYARLYSSTGAPLSPEFKVNTTTVGDQSFPKVAMDPAGSFVVTWSSSAQDGDSWGIYAQQFTSTGTPLGGEYRVNTTSLDTQYHSSIDMDDDGDFVISWESSGQDGSQFGIFAQRYNSSGVTQGEEFRVNTTTAETQRSSSVALDADGDFVVAWQSASQDGSGYGIYAQRYQLESTVKVSSGVLSVTGTNLGDSMSVDLVTPAAASSSIHVEVNGVNYDFDPTKINTIHMRGLGGNDALSISPDVSIPATLNGGAGHDNLTGGGGDDVLLGGAGNDTYSYNAGNALGSDVISDSSGIDTLDFSATLSVGVNVNLAVVGQQTVNANLQLALSSGSDIENLFGGNSDDTLTGNALANRLIGNSGADTLIGAAGNDTYLFDVDLVQHTDTIIESGGGIDTLDFGQSTLRGVSIDLGATGLQVVTPNFLSLILSENNTIENIVGSSVNDIITGNSASNVLRGGPGNDSYLFDADTPLGADTVDDSQGVDTLSFAATSTKSIEVDLSNTATQTVVNGNLTLRLSSGNSIENVFGGAQNDRLTGNALGNRFVGGRGDDFLFGGGGDDVYVFDTDTALGTDSIQESTGVDTLDFSSTTTQAISVDLSNTLTGQQVNPNLMLFLFTEFSIENVIGGSLGDTLTGNTLNNTFIGGPGNDFMSGGAGNDTYSFSANSSIGGDTVSDSGGGIDTLDFSGTTSQSVSVNLSLTTPQAVNPALSLTLAEVDTIENIIGGALSDTLIGNSLANSLTGGRGTDTLNGGAGNDVYLFDTDLVLGTDAIADPGGIDTLDFSATSTQKIIMNLGNTAPQVVTPGKLTLTLSSGNTIENVVGGALDDTLTGNSLGNRLTGGGGDDELTGGSGSDMYLFDADLLLGKDTINESAGSSDSLYFGATTGRSIMVDLNRTGIVQTVNDHLSILLNSGGDGIENVTGGFLADTIIGNSQANTLTGGAGDDVLSGGDGNDVFVFDTDTSLGTDTVRDSAGIDTLDFSLTTTQPIELDLSATTLQTINAGLNLILMSGAAIENANGGSLNDIIVGNSRGNVLKGNDGDDVLSGRAGNDILVGGNGKNILIGGDGTDQLTGGISEDLLLGARYLYEADTVALDSLRSEWSSASSFSARSGHLLGTLAGGANSGFTLTRSTVKEDSSRDTLIGGAGRDWYLRNSVGTPSTFNDVVTDTDLDSLFTEIESWI